MSTQASAEADWSQSAGEHTAALVRFVIAQRPDELPERVFHEAKRSLMNFFAVALAGAREPEIETLHGVLHSLCGDGRARLVGRRERASLPDAAFLNAAGANVHDFDDTHVPTVIHPTAPVAPALLALADTRPVGGRELLHALALGVEVACRIGNAVSPEHYRRGWHITATCGTFGAAAAAGKLLGLDEERMIAALGIAAAQACGLVECLGTGAKSVGVGNSARNGLVAALMAEAGLQGPAAPLEGTYGFLKVATSAPQADQLTQRLGQDWQLLRNTYKPYPCGVVLNPVIEACLKLLEDPKVKAGRISAVEVRGHKLLVERTDRPDIRTGRQSQVSAQHAVAAVLIAGAAGLPEFSDASVKDSAVGELRQRVSVAEDADLPVGAAVVVLRFADGGEVAVRLDEARGSLERPLSDADIEEKLTTLASSAMPGFDPRPLATAIWGLETNTDCRQLLDLAIPAS